MFLQRIVADTLEEVENRKRRSPLEELRRLAQAQSPALDLAAALRGNGVKLIAEIKRASPSRGVIRSDFDPIEIAKIYAANGAAAISVLTEPRHFLGSLDYLRSIRDAPGSGRPPLLRKDFILDPYQVYESRAYGADSLLLIVAILEPSRLNELLGLSHELGMKCLVEVHNEDEVGVAVASGARIIGINNRDLKTFKVDVTTTRRLRPLIPPDRIVVSESGIASRSDMLRLREWGVDAALVGEYLIRASDVAARMRELL